MGGWGMGEPAPNAGYNGGTRWGNPPPTRAIERLLRGYCGAIMGLNWAIAGEPAPNAGYREAIVKVIKILRLK